VEKTALTVEKKTAHVEIKIKSKSWVDPSALAKAIDQSGYKARREEIRLTLTGILTKENDVYLFTLGDVTPTKVQPFALSGDSATLEPLVGKAVRLEGAWQPAPKGESRAKLQVLKIALE
jgi:hypothetical protein